MNHTVLLPKSEDVLKTTDRCDKCQARALVLVKGATGILMFCGHHYNKIMDNAVGYDKMIKFAFEIVDNRSKKNE
jgi:hypothetical protein